MSDIPLLGGLFRTTNEKDVKTELIVMVTPHIIRSEEDVDRILRDFQDRIKTIKKEIDEMRRPGGTPFRGGP